MLVGYFIQKFGDNDYRPFEAVQYGDNRWQRSAWRIKKSQVFKTESEADEIARKHFIHCVMLGAWSYVGQVDRINFWRNGLSLCPVVAVAQALKSKTWYDPQREPARFWYKLKKLYAGQM